MVPHLAGRALTFRRFPDGADKQGFFEKRCPKHRPEWVRVALGPGDRDGGIEYCCIDETAALVWAANMAAIEIHVPMALAADLDDAACGGVRLRSRRAGDIVECCEIALRGARRARRRRARGVVQDVGLEGPAAVRAAEHAGRHARAAPPTSRSPSGRCSRSSSPSGSRP